MQRIPLTKIENWNERIIGKAAFITPVMTFPQLYSVWFGVSDGVSLSTWAAYFFVQFFWFFHALKIQDRVSVISSTMWLVIDFMIVLGLVLKHFV